MLPKPPRSNLQSQAMQSPTHPHLHHSNPWFKTPTSLPADDVAPVLEAVTCLKGTQSLLQDADAWLAPLAQRHVRHQLDAFVNGALPALAKSHAANGRVQHLAAALQAVLTGRPGAVESLPANLFADTAVRGKGGYYAASEAGDAGGFDVGEADQRRRGKAAGAAATGPIAEGREGGGDGRSQSTPSSPRRTPRAPASPAPTGSAGRPGSRSGVAFGSSSGRGSAGGRGSGSGGGRGGGRQGDGSSSARARYEGSGASAVAGSSPSTPPFIAGSRTVTSSAGRASPRNSPRNSPHSTLTGGSLTSSLSRKDALAQVAAAAAAAVRPRAVKSAAAAAAPAVKVAKARTTEDVASTSLAPQLSAELSGRSSAASPEHHHVSHQPSGPGRSHWIVKRLSLHKKGASGAPGGAPSQEEEQEDDPPQEPLAREPSGAAPMERVMLAAATTAPPSPSVAELVARFEPLPRAPGAGEDGEEGEEWEGRETSEGGVSAGVAAAAEAVAQLLSEGGEGSWLGSEGSGLSLQAVTLTDLLMQAAHSPRVSRQMEVRVTADSAQQQQPPSQPQPTQEPEQPPPQPEQHAAEVAPADVVEEVAAAAETAEAAETVIEREREITAAFEDEVNAAAEAIAATDLLQPMQLPWLAGQPAGLSVRAAGPTGGDAPSLLSLTSGEGLQGELLQPMQLPWEVRAEEAQQAQGAEAPAPAPAPAAAAPAAGHPGAAAGPPSLFQRLGLRLQKRQTTASEQKEVVATTPTAAAAATDRMDLQLAEDEVLMASVDEMAAEIGAADNGAASVNSPEEQAEAAVEGMLAAVPAAEEAAPVPQLPDSPAAAAAGAPLTPKGGKLARFFAFGSRKNAARSAAEAAESAATLQHPLQEDAPPQSPAAAAKHQPAATAEPQRDESVQQPAAWEAVGPEAGADPAAGDHLSDNTELASAVQFADRVLSEDRADAWEAAAAEEGGADEDGDQSDQTPPASQQLPDAPAVAANQPAAAVAANQPAAAAAAAAAATQAPASHSSPAAASSSTVSRFTKRFGETLRLRANGFGSGSSGSGDQHHPQQSLGPPPPLAPPQPLAALPGPQGLAAAALLLEQLVAELQSDKKWRLVQQVVGRTQADAVAPGLRDAREAQKAVQLAHSAGNLGAAAAVACDISHLWTFPLLRAAARAEGRAGEDQGAENDGASLPEALCAASTARLAASRLPAETPLAALHILADAAGGRAAAADPGLRRLIGRQADRLVTNYLTAAARLCYSHHNRAAARQLLTSEMQRVARVDGPLVAVLPLGFDALLRGLRVAMPGARPARGADRGGGDGGCSGGGDGGWEVDVTASMAGWFTSKMQAEAARLVFLFW
jgi:hypothetical protein